MSGDKSPYSLSKHRHPAKRYLDGPPDLPGSNIDGTDFVELCACSNFSFLQGASHPDEMVMQAALLGLKGIAIADSNSFAGIVRAHAAARKVREVQPDFQFIPGVRLTPYDPPPTLGGEPVQTGPALVTLPINRAAYGRLCALLTKGNRAAPKGRCYFSLTDICDNADEQIGIAMPPRPLTAQFEAQLIQLKAAFGDRLYLAATRAYLADDAQHLAALSRLSDKTDVPLIATTDALYHDPARRLLHDTVTAIRTHQKVDQAGFTLHTNAERHLKSGAEIARLHPSYQDAVLRTGEVAARCTFSLDELQYDYPDEVIGDGNSPQEALEKLTWAGAAIRYPGKVPDKVRDTLVHELQLIKQLDYARYFLTVYDIVRYAKEQNILCQGRGSAANSAVCYVIGITAVNPMEVDLLVERFISAARDEPPDIDVDFEHERREEVIQYIYNKYGRHRAGIAATVITYRWKSAIREVGKVLGLSDDITGILSKLLARWTAHGSEDDMLQEAGLDPADPLLRLAIDLAGELEGFPRHLSQHVGGFVITKNPLEEVIPIHNAAMDDRTFVEWDKDDLDALGMLKIDVLSLGMLTCIRKCFDLIDQYHGKRYTLPTIPRDDPDTYTMIQRADTIGVFQIESRAQMSMLPRLKPKNFYDLVVEVAIVRPGPIQGDMVHPYLQRRENPDLIDYAIPALEPVLNKTHGVPLFQEQAMKIAIVGAGFTPEEADQLRRAMATFRRNGTIHLFQDKFINGLVSRGSPRDFAERCFKQIEGFGDYGFPESHAASFALLAYASSWLKCYYPAAFACALLNSQPMGFYAAAQIVRDAREHGVAVLPPDVNFSTWDNQLEHTLDGPALRLGLRQLKGFKQDSADKLLIHRHNGYDSLRHLKLRAGLGHADLVRLAQGDCFRSLSLTRRQALWAAEGLMDKQAPPLLQHVEAEEDADEADLPPMPLGEQVVYDYQALNLTLRDHPLKLLSAQFRNRTLGAGLAALKTGRKVRVAGLVLNRQRPGTAKGVIFMTLEDETGALNIIVWAKTFEKFRRDLLTSRIMEVEGTLQNESGVIHIVADCLINRNDLFGQLMNVDMTPGQIDSYVPGRHPRNQQNIASLLPKSRDFH
ncbi:MAG: error-prone DNA polymerase [Alphaproteobacteria bacterium]